MSFPLSQVKWNLKTQDDAQGFLCISPALTVPGQSPSLPPLIFSKCIEWTKQFSHFILKCELLIQILLT